MSATAGVYVRERVLLTEYVERIAWQWRLTDAEVSWRGPTDEAPTPMH